MMKKMVAILIVLLLSTVVFSTYADEVRVPIDLKSMSTDELQSLADKINQEISQRNSHNNESEKAGTEIHTFDNGYCISVTGITVADGLCTVHYSFSHQNDEPTNFDIQDTVYQNGIELNDEYTHDDIDSYMRTTLKDTTVEVTKTYKLNDNSELTIYMLPWFSSEKPYTVTMDLP